MKHVYIHVPFCNGRCAYCAAYSERWDAGLFDRYANALAIELQRARDDGPLLVAPLESLYLGGGTPTCVPVARLAGLLDALLELLPVGRDTEFTVETAPDTLDAARATVLAGRGVNRLSIGMQAGQDAVLRALGRRHDSAAVARAVQVAREAGVNNIGLDLIAGLPGVSEADWRRTLGAVTDLQPAHVSVYALTLEPGTPLHASVSAGRLDLPSDADVFDHLDLAGAALAQAGLERYEISNFARPGCACRHNLSCWRGGDYLGAGPSAASRIGRQRRTNVADVRRYAAAVEQGSDPAETREALDPVTDVTERLLFRFRLVEGVDLDAHCRAYGNPGRAVLDGWHATAARLAAVGLLERHNQQWRLTPRGLRVADGVAAEFVAG